MIKKVTMSNINSKDHQDFYDFIHGKKTETKQPTVHTAQEYDLPPVKPRPVQKKYPLYEDNETYRHPVVRQVPQKPVEPPKPKMPRQLTEAYSLIEDMKVKMEDIFYRYGMIGLERLDEALEDVIDEIMNPEPVVIERPVPAPQPEKPVVKKRKRRVVRKPIQTQTNEATEDVEPDEVLVDPRKSLNDLDINDLGAILGKETKEYKTEAQKKTEQLLNAYGNEMETEQQKVQEAQAAAESAEIQQPEDIPDEPLEVIGENEKETAE